MTRQYKTILITLEKAIYGGYCLGRHEGKAILVPYGIPGETISASLTDEKKDFSFGSITSVIEESGERLPPGCPHFTECGGCSYLHVPYERELEYKRAIIEDNLGRIAGLTADNRPCIDIVHAGRYNYRSHGTIKAAGGCPGFYRRKSNELVSIRDTGCLLMAEELNAWLKNNNRLPDNSRIALDAFTRVITSFEEDPVIVEHAGGLVFERGIGQFFQANRFLRDRMLEIVREYAGTMKDQTLLDVGCGVGFFTLALAGSSSSCTGIDISGENIRWAIHNARLNRIPDVRFLAIPSSRLNAGRIRPGLIIADPPRAGIDKKSRKTIMGMEPAAIVYVSCNPSTFSRDTRDFIAGDYALERLTLIDMFPCTHHIEIISRFSRTRVNQSSRE